MRTYRMRHPDRLIREYSASLNNVVYRLITENVNKFIIEQMPMVLGMYRLDEERNDGFIDYLGNIFNNIKKVVRYAVPDISKKYADEVSSFNRKEVAKTISKSFLDIMIPNYTDQMKAFVNSNVALINGLTEDTQRAIVNKIMVGVANGATSGQIARLISNNVGTDKGVFQTVRTRLALIAQDQINKLNGQLTKLRQEQLGVTKFIWRTRLDDRVRDQHQRREGKVYSWDNPPDGEIPGSPINCRCWAEPVLNKKLMVSLNWKGKYDYEEND